MLPLPSSNCPLTDILETFSSPWCSAVVFCRVVVLVVVLVGVVGRGVVIGILTSGVTAGDGHMAVPRAPSLFGGGIPVTSIGFLLRVGLLPLTLSSDEVKDDRRVPGVDCDDDEEEDAEIEEDEGAEIEKMLVEECCSVSSSPSWAAAGPGLLSDFVLSLSFKLFSSGLSFSSSPSLNVVAGLFHRLSAQL